MCEAFYRDRGGALVATWLGCDPEIDTLWFRAEHRCWEGRVLVHVQPCLHALEGMLKQSLESVDGEQPGRNSAQNGREF